MNQPFDEYITTLTSDEQDEFRRIKRIVESVVPTVAQGVSYALPAFLYKGQPLLSCVVRKKFISLYPFSGKVIDNLASQLTAFETTSGSIHFKLDNLLPQAILEDLLTARTREIDKSLA
jgi:uncharacterized protein YdhG (YjbR/CyaY superfamily)